MRKYIFLRNTFPFSFIISEKTVEGEIIMNIKQCTIELGMGSSDDWMYFGFDEAIIKTLNNIGYGTEKRYGRGFVGFENFLNTLDKQFQYEVKQIKYNEGDYHETFLVTRVEIPSVTELCPLMEEHIATLKRKADILEKKAKEFGDEELQSLSHGIVALAEALKQDIKS